MKIYYINANNTIAMINLDAALTAYTPYAPWIYSQL